MTGHNHAADGPEEPAAVEARPAQVASVRGRAGRYGPDLGIVLSEMVSGWRAAPTGIAGNPRASDPLRMSCLSAGADGAGGS
ncbi:MAG: hypothetical protein ACRDGN_02080, partial [bacterium]